MAAISQLYFFSFGKKKKKNIDSRKIVEKKTIQWIHQKQPVTFHHKSYREPKKMFYNLLTLKGTISGGFSFDTRLKIVRQSNSRWIEIFLATTIPIKANGVSIRGNNESGQ